ncbi:hypothetical protein [Streptomyces sp. NPDC017448]|uniref:hypothetical protein n=1 Tax=Streptomyces sp. NPDC017448 TaxID=3364996 RepID=UPI0037BAEAF0
MSEIAATTVHEAYAFACMKCGYGWEQSYEIEHRVDHHGHAFVVYTADGERVPSPLSTPTCANCGGHVVRIMRAGRVAGVQELLRTQRTPRAAKAAGKGRAGPAAGKDGARTPGKEGPETAEKDRAEAPGKDAAAPAAAAERHGKLSGLLHPFHRR